MRFYVAWTSLGKLIALMVLLASLVMGLVGKMDMTESVMFFAAALSIVLL
jgi:hypothetical protein